MKRTKTKRLAMCLGILVLIAAIWASVYQYLRAESYAEKYSAICDEELQRFLEGYGLLTERDALGKYLFVQLIDHTWTGDYPDEVSNESMVLFTKAGPYCQLGDSIKSYGVFVRIEREESGAWKLQSYNSLNMQSHCEFSWSGETTLNGEPITQHVDCYVGRASKRVQPYTEFEVAELLLEKWKEQNTSDVFGIYVTWNISEYQIKVVQTGDSPVDFDVMGILEEYDIIKHDDWPKPYEIPENLIADDVSKLSEEERHKLINALMEERTELTGTVPRDVEGIALLDAELKRLGVIELSESQVMAQYPEAYWGVELGGNRTQKKALLKYSVYLIVVFAVLLVAYPFVIGPLWDRYRTKKNEREREERNLRIREKE